MDHKSGYPRIKACEFLVMQIKCSFDKIAECEDNSVYIFYISEKCKNFSFSLNDI